MARKRMVIAAVLIGAMVFTGGFFSYQLLNSKAKGNLGEDIPIGGYVVIKAYHADGKLYATWQGHNSLYFSAENAIAQCMSGNSTTPNLFGTCSPMTPLVWASGVEVNPPNAGVPFFATATNTMLPSGCTPVGNPPTCTGWQTTGTVTFSTGPPNNPTFPITLNSAGAAGQDDVPFDTVNLSPTITVNAGDSLVVTVTFSIS